jgi:hypothetical protein
MLKKILQITVINVLALLASSRGIHAAQNQPTPSVSLPVLTYVFDGANGLRPLIGIPGAASIGSALNLGFSISGAVVPGAPDYVLATSSDKAWPQLVQVRGANITVQGLDSFIPQPGGTCDLASDGYPKQMRRQHCQTLDFGNTTIGRIALSPSGSAVALFSESQRRAYAFTNLSQVPTLLGTFEVGSSDTLTALAISDDGRTAAFGFSNGDTGSVAVASINSASRIVASLHHPAAIAFFHGSDNGVAADDVDNKIYVLSSGQAVSVGTADNGISGPNTIAITNDNQRILVANSASGSVVVLNNTGTVGHPLKCNCTLTGLNPTNSNSVFRLTDFSGGPIVLLDASGPQPRILFVRNGSTQF